jgi:hypothetical protein
VPDPASSITFGVVAASSRLATSAGPAPVRDSSAAAPVTCGADIDVPDLTVDAVVLEVAADRMPSPGANTSTQSP